MIIYKYRTLNQPIGSLNSRGKTNFKKVKQGNEIEIEIKISKQKLSQPYDNLPTLKTSLASKPAKRVSEFTREKKYQRWGDYHRTVRAERTGSGSSCPYNQCVACEPWRMGGHKSVPSNLGTCTLMGLPCTPRREVDPWVSELGLLGSPLRATDTEVWGFWEGTRVYGFMRGSKKLYKPSASRYYREKTNQNNNNNNK